MIPIERLEQIRARYEFLEAKLNEGAAPAELAALAREYAGLKPVVEEIARLRGSASGRRRSGCLATRR
jgi:peptide chain release factor 1